METAWDVTAANDGRVIVVEALDSCVNIFSKDGHHLDKFKLRDRNDFPSIAFHQLTEHVVIARKTESHVVFVEICTKDGDFVRSTQIHEESIIKGMTVARDGRIALLLGDKGDKWNWKWKVLIM